MKHFYLFITGRALFAPDWWYKLPEFFQPIYNGKMRCFDWLGMHFDATDAKLGITLFGMWREKREAAGKK